MTFYNNRASIAHVDENQMYLFRNIDNKIIMDYYSSDNESRQETIIEDALGEFDVLITEDNEIYLIYQDMDQNLRILTINKEILNDVTLTKEAFPKIFELNMIQILEHISIIYVVLKSSKDGIFEIHHHLLREGEWVNYIVEEIRVDRLLNPIKILEDKNNIVLSYYHENQICVKEFHFDIMEWQESIILTDNKEKLYMDIIKENNYFHLVYSQYKNENLIIKYVRYLHNENSIIMEEQVDISNDGNPSNPTLIIEDENLWVIWNESSTLLSRYSKDMGLSWSPIYLWKKTRFTDIMRYKYIAKEREKNLYLDYGFGTIHPNIQFLGFGPLDDVEEIISKKKVLRNMLRL